MEIRKDYDPREIANALVSIGTDLTGQERSDTVDDCENALYQLMAIAENEYNFDYYRKIWEVLECLTEKFENGDILDRVLADAGCY